MKENDIRWEQRFANYRKALALLQKFLQALKFSFCAFCAFLRPYQP
jgi:hypothetical protein